MLLYTKKNINYTEEELAEMRKTGLVFLGEEDPEELKKQVVDLTNKGKEKPRRNCCQASRRKK